MTGMYTIETKDSPRGKWRRVRFATPMSREKAEALIAEMDEQGSGPCRIAEWK